MNILVLNAGSSSQKSNLYRIDEGRLADDPPAPAWEGKITWRNPGGPAEMTVRTGDGPLRKESLSTGADRAKALGHLLATLWQGEGAPLSGPGEISAVGHRVVHGGAELVTPVRVTPAVKEAIARLAPLAPAHNPAAREGMDAIGQILGESVPEVAVFDTAFHRTLPEAARVYPIPHAWTEDRGIRRYGFHGINHAWCAERAARLLGRGSRGLRLISCHLGNGCSLAAIRDGACVDTTMGFTPMEGLMMGARSGSVDPGIPLYLLRQGLSAEEIDHALNQESGLRGVSGVSEDLRDVMAAREQGDPRAALAIAIYVHRLRRELGGMLAVLGGADALVFTGGVGENSAEVRAGACAALPFLGLRLDTAKNEARPRPAAEERDIAAADSNVRVLVIPAQEDWAIARECFRLARDPGGAVPPAR